MKTYFTEISVIGIYNLIDDLSKQRIEKIKQRIEQQYIENNLIFNSSIDTELIITATFSLTMEANDEMEFLQELNCLSSNILNSIELLFNNELREIDFSIEYDKIIEENI